jgi:PIN like domain
VTSNDLPAADVNADDSGKSHASPGSVDPESVQPRAGIFDNGFEAYRTVTDADYLALFNSGLIILDANVLLDLYRYHPITRRQLLDVLERLQERLWVPNQAMSEFWSQRETVLEESGDVTNTLNDLKKLSDQYMARIRQWANRVGLDQEKLDSVISITGPSFESTATRIRALGTDKTLDTAKDTDTDAVVTRLNSILQDRVGNPLTPERRRVAVEVEAPRRFAESRPPGYKDARKKQGNPAGDYLIWIEMLEEARRRGVDVLFVTDDAKEDWWRIEHRQIKGPEPQLVAEMHGYANVRLFMLRTASLLKHVGDLLKVEVSPEAVQDAKRVSRRVFISFSMASNPVPALWALATRLGNLVISLRQSSPGARVGIALEEPIARLRETFTNEDMLDPILNAIWPVIEAADYSGLIASDMAVTPQSNLEREVWEAVGAMRNGAVRAWLENVADQVMKNYPDDPETGLDEIPLPPIIVSVGVEPTIWDDDGVGQVEFHVSLSDASYEVTTTRVVPLKPRNS